MLKRKFYILLTVILSCHIFLLSFSYAADLRLHRLALLDDFKKEVKFYSSGRMAQSGHFKVRIDRTSLEALDLKDDELITFLSGILYIFEEAYQLVGGDFDYYPSGKADIQILSRKQYNLQTDQSGKYNLTVGHSHLEIPFSSQEAKAIVTNFEEETPQIYRAFTRMITYGGKGPDFYSEEAKELAAFEKERALFCSRWLNRFTEEEQKSAIQSFNEEHASFYQKYSSYLKAQVARKTMKCKWCGADVDITGGRKGRRVKCPNCRNFIVVE